MYVLKSTIFLLILLVFAPASYSQKHHLFKADFVIKEKRTGTEKSSLMMGKVSYDNLLSKSEYDLFFPKKERWVIQDSFLTKYEGDSIVSKSKLQQVNDYIMFKNILEYKDNDFGLTSAGFHITAVEETDEELIMEWEPPANFQTFLMKVVTHVRDNLLMGIIFIDTEDKEISKAFYENYEIVKDLPVPMKITSHFTGLKEDLYKSISFKNVHIE
ncbi:MAG: hypothetical protein IPN29_19360 [Saprospiraceae bacterium]|nr:hypothetical protein [Saprospiraceae bacterium]